MSQDMKPIPGCFDSKDQSAERLTEMFVGIGQEGRIKLGQHPAERAVFRKLHGVASGRLVMEHDIPADLKVGVFAHDSLAAWVRFSSTAGHVHSQSGHLPVDRGGTRIGRAVLLLLPCLC